MKPFICAITLALLLMGSSGMVFASAGKETQITYSAGDELYAYIHEGKLVYMSEQVPGSGYFDIDLHEWGNDGVFGTADDVRSVVAGGDSDEFYPDIYEDLAVYVVGPENYPHDVGEDTSVHLLNLSNRAEIAVPDSAGFQCCPQIYKNNLIYHDYRNGDYDIYLYDIEDKKEFRITDEAAHQKAPQIWGRNIVWRDNRDDVGSIYLYDMGPDERFGTADDRGEFMVTSEGTQGYAYVQGKTIVWTDWRNWGSVADIYGYDMGPDEAFGTADDGGEFRVTDENSHQMDPRVYRNIIAWMDKRNGNYDIYAYDMGPDERFGTADDRGESALVTNPADQEHISMYGDMIVYDDDRHGNSDIYLYDLSAERSFGDYVTEFGYSGKQFYVAPAELYGALGSLDFIPISGMQIDAVSSASSNPVEILEGDIYALAAKKTLERYEDVSIAVLARGDLGVDAIAACTYARALGVPILLTKPNEIPDETRDLMGKLSVESITIVGGPVAVSEEIESEISSVSRIGGKDRYETAAMLAERLFDVQNVHTVVVTDGQSPSPEAVMLAMGYGAPVLYVNGDELPESTKSVLEKHKDTFGRVEMVGLSEKAEDAVSSIL